MALQAAYKQFLAAPNSALLANDASLHYVTTTTSFAGATEIIKHFSTQRNQIKKKKEEFLGVAEGQTTLAVEVETTLEFVSSGGAYLPALDDNFLADRIVYLPIVHFVSFDSDGKIVQIRQSWDQGSLLKQLDIIGKTGRNWPIRDSKDQLNLIVKCVKAIGTTTAQAAASGSEDIVIRSRGNSTNILRDPHASLDLFAPREQAGILPAAVVSPYAGRSRPRQRSFTEILGDEGEEETTSATTAAGRERSRSPTKAVAPKIGAGKNYQPSRLFETGDPNAPSAPDTPEKAKSPERSYRPNPKMYAHFDFGDDNEALAAAKAAAGETAVPKSKHGSQWGFDDFETPAKAVAASRALPRAQDVRHWGTENDEVPESPAKKTVPPKPRRDAETHFEFVDDGPAAVDQRAARPRGNAHNTGLGLYENNLYNEDGSAPSPGPDARALGNITNLKDRQRDFAAHFIVQDDQSQQADAPGAPGAKPPGHVPKVSEDRMKAVKMMESSWANYEESPAQKENSKPDAQGDGTKAEEGRGIVIAGDGMGGKKGQSGPRWGTGDDNAEQRAGNSVPGKKPGAAAKPGFWDF